MNKKNRFLLHALWQDHIKHYRKQLVLALILMSIEGAMMGALSYSLKPMFDKVFVGKNAGLLTLISLGIFVIFAVRAIAGFFQRRIVTTIGIKVVADIQEKLVSHLLTLDSVFFIENPPGVLIDRVRGDAQQLQSLSSTILMTLGRDFISLISLSFVLIWIDWKWMVFAFIGLPLLALPIIILQKRIRNSSRDSRQSSALLSNRLDEFFHGIAAIKQNSIEANERNRFSETIRVFVEKSVQAATGTAALPAMIDVVAAAGFLALFIFGGQEILSGEKTVGDFMSFFTALALIFDPLRRLAGLSGNVQTALASLERLYQLFETKARVLEPEQPVALTPLHAQSDIHFENVHFAYGENKVFQGLDLTIEKGKTIAIVGPSGAGKSTVFQLLTRMIDPDQGRLCLGETDFRALSLRDLRSVFAVVSQETALFDETIEWNISMGKPFDPEKMAYAIEAASVREFSDRLEKGVQTEVGPRGANLSGGQRQRVAIARAFLRDAPFLLLDEPTSALDPTSEKLIQAAIKKLTHGRTTLIIAHRFSTIQDADQILVMNAGEIVERGTHEELLSQAGLYKELYQTQARGI